MGCPIIGWLIMGCIIGTPGPPGGGCLGGKRLDQISLGLVMSDLQKYFRLNNDSNAALNALTKLLMRILWDKHQPTISFTKSLNANRKKYLTMPKPGCALIVGTIGAPAGAAPGAPGATAA